jgi:excisionase family DNA binding protein
VQQQMMQQQQQPQAPAQPATPPPAPAPAPSGGIPDLMTLEQAAEALQVSNEDVIAAIEAGDLKGRKIGSQYRITKAALEEFLNG